MSVFDSLHSKSHQLGPGRNLPPATGNGFMDRTQFVSTEFHGIPPGNATRSRMRIPASMKKREFKASRKWAKTTHRISWRSEFNFVSEWSGSRQHRSAD